MRMIYKFVDLLALLNINELLKKVIKHFQLSNLKRTRPPMGWFLLIQTSSMIFFFILSPITKFQSLLASYKLMPPINS